MRAGDSNNNEWNVPSQAGMFVCEKYLNTEQDKETPLSFCLPSSSSIRSQNILLKSVKINRTDYTCFLYSSRNIPHRFPVLPWETKAVRSFSLRKIKSKRKDYCIMASFIVILDFA